MLLILWFACAQTDPLPRRADPGDGRPGDSADDTADTGAGDSGADESGADDSGADDTGSGPCPAQMRPVNNNVCVDVFEAALEEQGASGAWTASDPTLTVDGRTVRAVPARGTAPQGYISGTEAEAACEASGKRLCTSAEWLAACQGPSGNTYPYGDTHQTGACNDDYDGHPVVDYFGTSDGVWDSARMNDPGINQQPGTVAAGGAHPDCVSEVGAYDLHGNLHEWVADAEGTFRGGFYADASINGPGCSYVTTAHSPGYHDYSTGFRCCLPL